jgi:predicted DNA binding CopG/RHH family protein
MINKSNKVKITTYLGKNQFSQLKERAIRMEISYATLIRMAVDKYLKEKDK